MSSIVFHPNLHQREWLPQTITKFAAVLSNNNRRKQETRYGYEGSPNLSLGVVMIFPAVASSEAPVNSETLGRVEGTLAFCAKLDPQSAAKYQGASKIITQGKSEKEVESARVSKEYQDAFEEINVELGKASNDDAVKACTVFLEEK